MNKKERRLEENSDYVVVNNLVWNVLIKLYGGGPEINATVVKFN